MSAALDADRVQAAWVSVYGAAWQVDDPDLRRELLGMASRLQAISRDKAREAVTP